jgi:hypothetical protein
LKDDCMGHASLVATAVAKAAPPKLCFLCMVHGAPLAKAGTPANSRAKMNSPFSCAL